MISMIAAQGANRELGYKGQIPWQLSEDQENFKKLTKGHTMIMGRLTFQSLPGVLPGRIHVIMTRDPSFHKEHPRVRIRHDLEACLEEAAASSEEIFVIGGGEIYQAALPYAQKIYLTQVEGSYPADAYFPALSPEEWECVEESFHPGQADTPSYRYGVYTRRGLS